MCSDRARGRAPVKPQRRVDGRYIRFSFRYDSWQVQTPDKTWANIRPEMARAYAAAGFPIGVQTDNYHS
jgi:hypothetical protein